MAINQTTFIKTLIDAARVYVSYEPHEEPVAAAKEIVAIHKFDVELFEDGQWDVELDVTYRDCDGVLQFIHLVSQPDSFNVVSHGNTF
jgi:uncharacterized protein YfdQ (DUF2303 family)